MAKLRGRGYAAVNYPTGMNLGGDPSQALIHSTTTGSFVVTLYVDAGAYSRHSPYGTTKASAHMPGPYSIPNVWVDAHCVYTNRTPSSAMRGFGVTIADYALESQMDRIARELDVDPLEIRLKNAYRDGDMKAHRKIAEGTALIEVMQRAAELVGHELSAESRALSSTTPREEG